jgi:hypothetical protein
MTDLTTADEFETGRATKNGNDIDGFSLSRWSKKGDRLYLNGVSKFEKHNVYVDLETATVEGVPSSSWSTDVTVDGDTLTIEISRGKVREKTYLIEVDITGEAFANTEPREVKQSTEPAVIEIKQVAADGGSEEIKSLEDLGGRRGDRVVRYYGADGTLYAYRDGDEHVVVSRGGEPRHRWTDRVAAERTAVLPGEQLWTVPDNWTYLCKDKRSEHDVHGLYRIAETGRVVRLSLPHNTHLVDAWYHVKAVGTLEAGLAETGVDRAGLEALAEELQEWEADLPDGTLDVVERLAANPDRLERAYADAMEPAVDELVQQEIIGDSWTLSGGVASNPWHPTLETDHIAEMADGNRERGEAYAELDTEFSEQNILSRDPDVEVRVEPLEEWSMEEALTAAAEAGLSGGEAYDYLMTEIADRTQTEWAETRGIGQGSVSKNVSQALRKLKS